MTDKRTKSRTKSVSVLARMTRMRNHYQTDGCEKTLLDADKRDDENDLDDNEDNEDDEDDDSFPDDDDDDLDTDDDFDDDVRT